jgi:phosphoenolpyruvate carboxykinase (ATP)
MHCAANVGASGDTALFFGLSGTGKTTLSADPERSLIGDDEHGWSDHGIFNFEGGCYAKVINLSAQNEPQIYTAVRQFGAVLENVALDLQTREPNYADDSVTENTRGAYPISHIPHAVRAGMGGHPRNLLFLSADSFGVLPPVARLTPEQARYYFLSGYTARVAGTERGIVEPQATFSTCFGAPFLPLPPQTYSAMLGERLRRHGAQVWLINTGWTGGPYGVGKRMSLPLTRAIVRAALDGSLHDVPTEQDPIFGLHVPLRCPGVPSEVLHPRQGWPDAAAYETQARRVAGMFIENFEQFASLVPPAVREAGPRPA